jgi:hypothetical protein
MGVDALMRIHRAGLMVLFGFAALFALALDVRLGIAALVAASIIDWLYIVAPFWRPRQKPSEPSR